MAISPTTKIASGKTPLAHGDDLPSIVTPSWWLVSMKFLLRITCFGAEGYEVIGAGFSIIPILPDFLKMAF